MPGYRAEDESLCEACLGRHTTSHSSISSAATQTDYDVLVIGNGPSGILLSYMLSGNTPYFSPTGSVPEDDLLHLRLNWQDATLPLTDMDILELGEGLEGRTTNPVALVFDQLCHPYADNGMQIPSQLQWRLRKDRAVSHLVIGKSSQPGGVWQSIEGDMWTLSKANWMELPGVSIADFLRVKRQCGSPRGRTETRPQKERASVAEVKAYYEYFVKANDISANFLNNSVVTSVEKVGAGDGDVCWLVNVENLTDETSVTLSAKSLVVAVGTSDVPNRLRVAGEGLPFVRHSVSNMTDAFADLDRTDDPVLVVGAGLSASDAILAARQRGRKVVHVFRETPCGNPKVMLRSLPRAVYPEYVHMYELMCGDVVADWYKPYAQFSVQSFTRDRRVIIVDDLENEVTLDIAAALIQIGSSPDLSFLPAGGKNLGYVKDKRIDSKRNLMDIDPGTYESRVEPGLYALGPLVGDNFVRFLKGGALAIARDIQRKTRAN